MQRRIRYGILTVAVMSVIIISLLLSFIFYNLLKKEVRRGLWDHAEVARRVLNKEEDTIDALFLLSSESLVVRYTLIDSDGIVLFDNQLDVHLMPNHSDRLEFKLAKETGKGESTRFSNTLKLESYYVAYLLNDNSIIRLSQSNRSIFGVFSTILPAILLISMVVIMLCNILSKNITKRIIEPINRVNLEDEDIILYDELSIFVKTIKEYKEQIKMHISDIESKSEIINSIILSIKEGIILLNSEGTIILANKSVLDLFEENYDVLNKNILELTRNNDILEKTNKALLGENCEMIFIKGERIYQIFFSTAREGGVIILFLDIKDKINSEKMRKEFTANVTHELKTPLANISGYAEMMSSGMVNSKNFPSFSFKIKDEASRLISLIDDILLLSQLDEKNMFPKQQVVDLCEISKKVIEDLSKKAVESNITLKLKCEKIYINANANMMYELLFNLVDNGIKYNKPNGEVNLSISKIDGKFFIKVEDTGIGIPLEHKERVFERFYRVDKSRSKKTGGTGLGLSIVKHIVIVYNGIINMESKVGIGTTITIEIPE